VLGAVAARHNGEEVNLGRRQERCLLGLLLLDAGRVVSADQLLDRLWHGAPPESGRRTLHTYVARLRGRLTPFDVHIVTRGAGYAIDIGPAQVDVHRFVAEVARARELRSPAARAEALTAALGLWRGPLLAGVADDDLGQRLSGGLEETRLAAIESCLEARLAVGQHLDVVGPLTEIVAQYPTRERPPALLMLALFRSGRTADAIEVYRRLRRVLVDEFGLDPGDDLQRLHRQILGNDPVLTASAPAGVDDAPRRGRRFLPRDVPDFTGRVADLARLDAVLQERSGSTPTAVVSAIAGLAGVGKTALAVRWAHAVAHQFADGQLYVNLRGYDPRLPMRSIDALGRLLRALDVPSERIPPDLDDAAALYRSVLADQRVLILLDNARSAEQVRPLLPGNPACCVVVTSRDGLGGLIAREGARRIVLETMTPDEAAELLRRMLGHQRVEAPAAAELAVLCGHLPLALRIAAAQLADRSDGAMADYIARLRGSDRLAALAIDGDADTELQTIFNQSYRALAEPEQRMFRLLGLVPGDDVTVAAVAALADLPAPEVAPLLDRLVCANLVTGQAAGRYSMHDLIREFALKLAREDGDGEAAVPRLLAFYLRAAAAAVTVVAPQAVHLPAPEDESPIQFTDRAHALAWLETEQTNLVAATLHASTQGPRPMAWQLADVLRGYFWMRRDFDAWTTTAETGLAAATAVEDRSGQAAMRLSLGIAYRSVSQLVPAIDHLRAALALSREVAWVEGEAAAIGSLGIASAELGRNGDALTYFSGALALNRRLGRDTSVAVNLGNIGTLRALCGELQSAVTEFGEALALYRRTANRAGEALMMTNLGLALYELGRLDEALGHLEPGLAIHREIGDRYGESIATVALGQLSLRLGRVDVAADLAAAAERLADETNHTTSHCAALTLLGAVHQQRGDAPAALASYTSALTIARGIGYRVGQGDALDGLAQAYLSQGQDDEASARAEEALAIATTDGYATVRARALSTLAEIRLSQGRAAEATEAAEQALSICAESGYAHIRARAERAVAAGRGLPW